MKSSAIRLLSMLSVAIGVGCGEASAWTKSFVVDWLEPAFYFGNPAAGDAAPGTDCPAGAVPNMEWRKVLKTSYRTQAEVDKLIDPENPQHGRMGGIRGPDPKKTVHDWPWLMPDPGLQPVSGQESFGFDLDGDRKTGFAIGLNGDAGGVDNEYYRALGCLMTWRGSTKLGHHAKYVMDGMRDGSFTILITLSGKEADWRNDQDARMAIYMGKDKMVKDATGETAADYTFRANPWPGQESVIPVKLEDGVVTSKAPAGFTFRGVDGPVTLSSTQMRFALDKNGHLGGYVGGYRSVEAAYQDLARGGPIFELTMQMNIVAVYYALHRNADGLFDSKTGTYSGISTAYRIYATPAFVVSPNGKAAVTEAQIFTGETLKTERPFSRRLDATLLRPTPEEATAAGMRVPNLRLRQTASERFRPATLESTGR